MTGIVQAAVKIVLEPVFEADFLPRKLLRVPARSGPSTTPCRCSLTSACGAAGGRSRRTSRVVFRASAPEVDASGGGNALGDQPVLKLLGAMLRAGVMEGRWSGPASGHWLCPRRAG